MKLENLKSGYTCDRCGGWIPIQDSVTWRVNNGECTAAVTKIYGMCGAFSDGDVADDLYDDMEDEPIVVDEQPESLDQIISVRITDWCEEADDIYADMEWSVDMDEVKGRDWVDTVSAAAEKMKAAMIVQFRLSAGQAETIEFLRGPDDTPDIDENRHTRATWKHENELKRTALTGYALAAKIAAKYDIGFERSNDDGSYASTDSLRGAEAQSLAAELIAAAFEASDALDEDDRSKRWVYISIDGE